MMMGEKEEKEEEGGRGGGRKDKGEEEEERWVPVKEDETRESELNSELVYCYGNYAVK